MPRRRVAVLLVGSFVVEYCVTFVAKAVRSAPFGKLKGASSAMNAQRFVCVFLAFEVAALPT